MNFKELNIAFKIVSDFSSVISKKYTKFKVVILGSKTVFLENGNNIIINICVVYITLR